MAEPKPLDGAALEELSRLRLFADAGPVSIERRDDDDGTLDYILYGKCGYVAACFETANEHAKHNAEYIAKLLNSAPALLAMARQSLTARDELDRARARIGELERENADLSEALAECGKRNTAALRAITDDLLDIERRLTEAHPATVAAGEEKR